MSQKAWNKAVTCPNNLLPEPSEIEPSKQVIVIIEELFQYVNKVDKIFTGVLRWSFRNGVWILITGFYPVFH